MDGGRVVYSFEDSHFFQRGQTSIWGFDKVLSIGLGLNYMWDDTLPRVIEAVFESCE